MSEFLQWTEAKFDYACAYMTFNPTSLRLTSRTLVLLLEQASPSFQECRFKLNIPKKIILSSQTAICSSPFVYIYIFLKLICKFASQIIS